MKHTKGEWFAYCTDNVPHFVFAEDSVICAMKVNDPASDRAYERLEGLVTIEECRANAKLIAAAPDLLEALLVLKKWVGKLEDWRGEDPPYELVDIAIKKATE